MGWEDKYRKDEEGQANVMETSVGTVHALSTRGDYTLCRIPLKTKHRWDWDVGLKVGPKRVLSEGDSELLCPRCRGRLNQAAYAFPWEGGLQTVSRLEGLGYVSAKVCGEGRISIDTIEMEDIVSLLRRRR